MHYLLNLIKRLFMSSTTASYFEIQAVTKDPSGSVTLSYADTNGKQQTYQIPANSLILNKITPQANDLFILFPNGGFTVAPPEELPTFTWQNVQQFLTVDTEYTTLTTASGVAIPLPLTVTNPVTIMISDLFAPVTLS